jgi:hypothetical protein
MPSDRATRAKAFPRRAVASAASLTLAAAIFWSLRHEILVGWSHVRWQDLLLVGATGGLPLLAAALIWSDRLAAQLLARGCWWCYFALGVVVSIGVGADGGREPTFGVLCMAAALVAAGGSGLDGAAAGRFKPVAFRGTLLISLVLAIADATSLMAFGVVLLHDGHLAAPLFLGALLAVGVVGLIRLRTWGLLVSLGANVVVGALALAGHEPFRNGLRVLYLCTTALQLVIPLPMLVTLVLRRAPPADRWRRAKSVAVSFAVVGLAALSAYAAFFHDGPLLR